MAFKNTVLQEYKDLGAGEVLKSFPHSVTAHDSFEDGLRAGRFAQIKAGVLSNLDGTATPAIVGIPLRKVTGEIADDSVYTKTGLGYDSVAELIDFGYATVEISAGADPKRYDKVNVLNDATVNAGQATEEAVASGIVAAGDVIFWEPKAAGVWLIRFNKYL